MPRQDVEIECPPRGVRGAHGWNVSRARIRARGVPRRLRLAAETVRAAVCGGAVGSVGYGSRSSSTFIACTARTTPLPTPLAVRRCADRLRHGAAARRSSGSAPPTNPLLRASARCRRTRARAAVDRRNPSIRVATRPIFVRLRLAARGRLELAARALRELQRARLGAYRKAVERSRGDRRAELYQACLTYRIDRAFAGDRGALPRAAAARSSNVRRISRAARVAIGAALPNVPAGEHSGASKSRPIKAPPARRGRSARRAREPASRSGRTATKKPHDRRPRAQRPRPRVRGGERRVPSCSRRAYASFVPDRVDRRGAAAAGCDAFDAIGSVPPGSMTGAPKIAAMSAPTARDGAARFYSGRSAISSAGGADLAS